MMPIQTSWHSYWFRLLAAITLLEVSLNQSTPTPAQITNQPQQPKIINQADYTYVDNATNNKYQATSPRLESNIQSLQDPLGRVLGCGGQPLADYTGFMVALYEPDLSDATGTELGKLISLTSTELPDLPNNNISSGISPNSENINPFPLTNTDQGFYNFLLDPNRGQTDLGRTYILVVNPPRESIYNQRRIRLEIVGSANNNVVSYMATSLDGQPISSTGETQIFVANAETTELNLFALQFDSILCQSEQIQIVKTGDRAVAEPGDTVIYRLSIKNIAEINLDNIVAFDTFPLGFKFLANSVRGELQGQPVTVTTEETGSVVTLKAEASIPPGETLNIAYAAQITPDAGRGSGRNSATISAQRSDNDFSVKDGPTTHRLRVDPGLLSDCGTLIGRVFEDKNFDGEQQPGEPGIPNAVIFLEDGNRITTDTQGLFSVANVLPGYHTGVLDLTSVPGYTIAPNHHFSEGNSKSRLVRLEPGGLARMNFAVTPTLPKE